ncbi:MAG: hypothetical protein GTN78_24405 [Gemmatimonadales bacterium]|nr:hypothetical protein [Gemmatimonadales bacterium]NIN12069.1 hypothetical protein [Gemmatimonadales bacterium]NIR03304.1 hypothetical protein [Gemmatimonadales bacterium]NIS66984.1 hypothetical protein [Gemmatimonadales bacterium]
MITKLLVGGGALLSLAAPLETASSAIPPAMTGAVAHSSQDTAYATQISEGEVTLELEPRWEDSVLVVEVRANTHSVDLSGINLREVARLVVDDTSVTPVEAGSLSGHHATAKLVFHLAERPTSFAIEIRDVPDVPLRLLKWPAGDAKALVSAWLPRTGERRTSLRRRASAGR